MCGLGMSIHDEGKLRDSGIESSRRSRTHLAEVHDEILSMDGFPDKAYRGRSSNISELSQALNGFFI